MEFLRESYHNDRIFLFFEKFIPQILPNYFLLSWYIYITKESTIVYNK